MPDVRARPILDERGRFIHCRPFRKGHCYRRMVKRENCPSLRLVFIARRCCNGTRGRECLPCGYTHTHTRTYARARNVAEGSPPIVPSFQRSSQFSKIVSKRVQLRICVCPSRREELISARGIVRFLFRSFP